MSAAQRILSGLSCGKPGCQCVGAAGRGRGETHCPAHDDRTPSLSIRAGRRLLVLREPFDRMLRGEWTPPPPGAPPQPKAIRTAQPIAVNGRRAAATSRKT